MNAVAAVLLVAAAAQTEVRAHNVALLDAEAAAAAVRPLLSPAGSVVVDPRTPVPRDIAAVSASHFTGARNVAAHLVSLGHRRIGMINGPGDWLASSSRFAGHASALAEVGVLVAPELVTSIEPNSDWGYSAACTLLDLPDRVKSRLTDGSCSTLVNVAGTDRRSLV